MRQEAVVLEGKDLGVRGQRGEGLGLFEDQGLGKPRNQEPRTQVTRNSGTEREREREREEQGTMERRGRG